MGKILILALGLALISAPAAAYFGSSRFSTGSFGVAGGPFGEGTVASSPGDSILLETGDYLLLETGDKLLKE